MRLFIKLFILSQIAFLVSACSNNHHGMTGEKAPISRHDSRWNHNYSPAFKPY